MIDLIERLAFLLLHLLIGSVCLFALVEIWGTFFGSFKGRVNVFKRRPFGFKIPQQQKTSRKTVQYRTQTRKKSVRR
jgi:hypothetical protein